MNKKIVSLGISALMSLNVMTPVLSYAAENQISYRNVLADNKTITLSDETATTPTESDETTTTPTESSEEDFTITNGVLEKYNGTATNVIIPEGVTQIKSSSGVFGYNGSTTATSIESITLPSTLVSIPSNPFTYCTSLKEIKVNENNEMFKSVDNVLYNKSGLELLVYPAGKTDKELSILEGCKSLSSCAFYGNKTLEVLNLPLSLEVVNATTMSSETHIKTINVNEKCTKIADGAFKNCIKIKTINLPEGIESIGNDAFSGCRSLDNFKIPKNVKSIGSNAFYYCNTLNNLEVPEGVKNIGESAFENCTALSDISLPNGLESIGKGAFKYCWELASIKIPENVTAINEEAFAYCTKLESIEMPKNIKNIEKATFEGCSKLTSVNLPDGLESIGNDSFSNCPELDNVKIPEKVNAIGDRAFSNCTKLQSIEIPKNVKSIGVSTFKNCTGLTSVSLPEELENIGSAAFLYCSGLTSIEIPKSVKSIGSSAFGGCTKLTSMNLPEGLESMESSLFKDCTQITNIKIPESVKNIGSYVFSGCSNLTSISLPEGLESIGSSAFYKCSQITTVKIPKNVKNIGYSAFENCPKLTSVSIYSKDIKFGTNNSTVFTKNASNFTLQGYKGSTTEAYAQLKKLSFVPFDNVTKITFEAEGQEPIVEEVAEGEILSAPQAPTKDGYIFVGWYSDIDDITTEFKENSACTQDATYKAKYAHVEMLGAQAKLVVGDKSGIRFGTRLYNDGDEIVEKGTLIIPSNLLQEGEVLTLDTKKAARSIGKVNYEVNKEQNYITYLGTIVNIPKVQFERQLTAASYVIYKDKAGNQYTIYSQYPNGSISVLDLLGNDADWNEEW